MLIQRNLIALTTGAVMALGACGNTDPEEPAACPDEPGIACTWAGIGGTRGFNGDGKPRLDSWLYFVEDLSFAPDGRAWLLDWNNHRVRRVEAELKEALKKLEVLKQRAAKVHVEGGRIYNPGWHLALDLASLLTVSECCALAALERKESRGGHTREDHPYTDDIWGTVNLVSRQQGDRIELRREPLPQMPPELKALFQERK